jgi:hypothetical protein
VAAVTSKSWHEQIPIGMEAGVTRKPGEAGRGLLPVVTDAKRFYCRTTPKKTRKALLLPNRSDKTNTRIFPQVT